MRVPGFLAKRPIVYMWAVAFLVIGAILTYQGRKNEAAIKAQEDCVFRNFRVVASDGTITRTTRKVCPEQPVEAEEP